MNTFLSILSALFLMAGLWIGFYNYRFLKISQAIEGKVVRIDTTSTANSGKRHMPIIEYTNDLGQKRQFTTSVTSLNSEIGNRVWLAYHPPTQKVKLISLGEIFLPFTIMCLFGLVLLFILLPLSIDSQFTYRFLQIFNLLAE